MKNTKAKKARRRLYFYGPLILTLWGFWAWIPQKVRVFDNKPKTPLPLVNVTDVMFKEHVKIAVVVGHPDDSEFYIGATLLKLAEAGAEVTLIACTNGDKAYYPFFMHEKGLAEKRQAEQREAAARWKGEVVFLGFMDGRLHDDDESEAAILHEFERVKPDVVLSFDDTYTPRVFHQDHLRAGEAAIAATRRYGMNLGKPIWFGRFATTAPNYFVAAGKLWTDRLALLAIHKSQFSGEKLKRIEGMITETAANYGNQCGTDFAEGFRFEEIK